MNVTAQSTAENASFRAFMNCYLREIDTGRWVEIDSPSHHLSDKNLSDQYFSNHTPTSYAVNQQPGMEVYLETAGVYIYLEITYRSIVGCHHFGRTFISSNANTISQKSWKEIDGMSLLLLLIRQIYSARTHTTDTTKNTHTLSCASTQAHIMSKNEVELCVRLLESTQLMGHYISSRMGDERLNQTDFICAEQSNIYGHWLHPTPKSRQGMTFWQQSHYSPELTGEFQLYYFSVDAQLIKQGGSLDISTSDAIQKDIFNTQQWGIPDDHILVPAHPLQAQYLLLQDWVKKLIKTKKIINFGQAGKLFTPTSSVRTLFNDECQWMYKFSIPVKITNSLRCNKLNELETGMAIESHFKQCGFLERRPEFSIVDDPAYLTVVNPNEKNTESGFEIVLRRNPFNQENGHGICSILSLVQEPLPNNDGTPGTSLLKKLVDSLSIKESKNRHDVALLWFKKYFSCSIESLILLYDQEGIALEAHQQNSLLDVSNGYPSRYYYRDNQGFYLSTTYRDSLQAIANQLTMSDIFYEDSVIFEAISYYLFINQLFSVIYRLGADNLIEENVLIEHVKTSLTDLKKDLHASGKKFVDHLLSSKSIAYKANLLARVRDIDELHQGMERAVYANLTNPLYDECTQRKSSQTKHCDIKNENRVSTTINASKDCHVA